MPYSRKFQGTGQLAATDTTIYAPSSSSTGTIGVLSFYNGHTAQVTVTVYSPHTGTPGRILEKFSINPGKSHICRPAINQVIEGASSYELSALASVASVVDYTCSGAEE